MTSPYVSPATAPSAGQRPSGWRILLVAFVCAIAPPGAAIAAFAAAITWSGCFIECAPGSADHLSGAGLWLLAVAFLVVGPVLAWWLLRSSLAVLAAVGGVLASLLTAGLLVGVN